jgi:hypothetical protein
MLITRANIEIIARIIRQVVIPSPVHIEQPPEIMFIRRWDHIFKDL